MDTENESAKRKMDSQPLQMEVPPASKWERKRGALSKGIQWDEETIAEHDKERGTRQKIDEPPTPYSYFSFEGDVDSSTQPAQKADSELPEEVDYNSDCEFLNDSEKMGNCLPSGTGSDKPEAQSATSSSSLKKGRITVVQSASATVFDNWETLQAKLNYQKQLQEIKAPNARFELAVQHNLGVAQNAVSNGTHPLLDAPGIDGNVRRNLPDKRFQFSPSKSADTRDSDGELEGGKYADSVEGGDFKNKRAAHYNEFKLVQAMRSRQKIEDDEDDEEET